MVRTLQKGLKCPLKRCHLAFIIERELWDAPGKPDIFQALKETLDRRLTLMDLELRLGSVDCVAWRAVRTADIEPMTGPKTDTPKPRLRSIGAADILCCQILSAPVRIFNGACKYVGMIHLVIQSREHLM